MVKSFILFMAVLFAGCAMPSSNTKDSLPKTSQKISVANWNVQTFFDSTTEGCEYDEFVKSKTWGQESYTERLKRLCQVIKSLDADVFVMEEIENEEVLHDLSNFLAGEWNQKKIYSYACFAKESGSSIGCAVLSRLPIKNLRLHSLDIRTQNGTMPRMRPLMQVEVCKGSSSLTLFINHWKSMSGGEAVTEKWRNAQEAVLSQYVGECVGKGKAVFCCGDFNRDVSKFKKGSDGGIILLRTSNCGELEERGTEVFSPWYDSSENLIEPGSYYYNGEWSRIDNIFYAGNAEVENFAPRTDGPWCEEDSNVPKKYKIWNGTGYSDHLPLTCTVTFY